MAKQNAPQPEADVAPPRPARASLRRDPTPPEDRRTELNGHSDAGRLAAEVARLESELAAMRAKLRELETRADIDPLTDVFNRRGFDRELKRVVSHVARYGGSAALVYLDLDGFKQVNDRHGHAAGDAVLQAVAAALLQRVRASDTVARLGGDEFAVLLWNLDQRNAAAKASTLEAVIDALRISFGDAELAVGVSAGVAMLDAGQQPADVLACADAAMYTRKNARKCVGGP
jgi:diguanylate cyclase (GGDEF)-like protein